MTIELRGVTKRFGRLVAVDAIDLEVAEGEVLCLLGPSGCGKTTTLRMIAGLEEASDGEILLAGHRVNEQGARDRDVAMSFQFYALYPSLTVAQNLAFPLHAEKLSRKEIAAKVEEVTRVLQLGQILDRLPGQLAEGGPDALHRGVDAGWRSAARSSATPPAFSSTSRSRAST